MFDPQFQGRVLALAGFFFAPGKIITADADMAVGDNDFKIGINKTVAGASALPLPTTSIPTSRGLVIYDAKGDAGTNNITVQGGGNNIDGAANYVISRNFGLVWIEWTGTIWKVLLELNNAAGAVGAHAATHQNGGADALTVYGNQAANLLWAGPASGAAAAPAFRALAVNDLPNNHVKQYSGAGVGAAGPVAAVGTKVGDKVLAVIGFVTATGVLADIDARDDFEATVTVVDQIQQVDAGDLSANTYLFLVQPKS